MTAKILIVEDESIVAQDLQFILEDLGYDVPAIADSGEIAIQKTIEIQPDLIIMDIRIIGEMDGISTAQIIVNQFDIPIIYSTAHSDDETLNRAKQTEPAGYIIKPFDERELRTNIELALYRNKINKQLKDHAQWLATVLKSIGDGVITTDQQGKVTFINAIAEKLTGWPYIEALGKDVRDIFILFNELTKAPLDNPIYQVLKTGKLYTLPQNTLLISKDGTQIPIEDSIAPIASHSGSIPLKNGKGDISGAVLVFRDVTQKRLTAHKLHRKAFYDDLTGLPNRAWIRERLTDALNRYQRTDQNYSFAVMFLDLDRFKIVNDTLGHNMGDVLLTEVASRLQSSIRSIDTVARLGGDEFAILLELPQNIQETVKIAQRIEKAIAKPFKLGNNQVLTKASIGIVFSSREYNNIDDMIRDADISMYRAKSQGKGGHVIFDPLMREEIIVASQLEADLRNAIVQNELEAHYQPIVSVKDSTIVGFEALLRWNHPKRGQLTPFHFIPIAEEIGLIVEFDRWILREACTQMKQWQKEYPHLSDAVISVNLSSRGLGEINLVETIVQILQATDLAPNCLKLEITETALIENPKLATTLLAELRELGIALALDDFGTGYSSLSYLHRFPVNTLKIDRSFVNQMESEQNGLEIVRTIILLGRTLGMDVVAEGIETTKQLDLLQELQCEYGQGYFFSKPFPGTLPNFNFC